MSNFYSTKGGYRSKPLKGISSGQNNGVFDTLIANTVKFENISIEGIIEDVLLSNIVIEDSIITNTVIGLDGPNVAQFTELTTLSDVTFQGSSGNVIWNSYTSLLTIDGELRVIDCSQLGNIKICGNTISAENLNGDIIVSPNGIGKVFVTGPINNVSSYGDFIVNMMTGGSSITTIKNQRYTSETGDIIFNVGQGDFYINTTQGDIILSSSTLGNIRIPEHVRLTFDLVSTSNSIYTSNGDFIVTGDANDLLYNYFENIYLNASIGVSIPTDTTLNIGTSSIYTNTSHATLIENNNINSSIKISAQTTQLSNTAGQLIINNSGTQISSGSVIITGNNTEINTENTRFRDPILTIANYDTITNDELDRGIEYKYFNTSGGVMNTGWFGYKNSTGNFTFYNSAENNGEIITGTLGNIEANDIFVNNIVFSTSGTLDIGCGTLANVHVITGCNNEITITTGTIYMSSSDKVVLPNYVELEFGTAGSSLSTDSSGFLIISGDQVTFNSEIQINQEVNVADNKTIFLGTSGNAIHTFQDILTISSGTLALEVSDKIYIPENIPIEFGTGGTRIINTNGNLLINSTTGDIILQPKENTGNIIVPVNTDLNFANTSNGMYSDGAQLYIYGNNTAVLTFPNLIIDGNVNILGNLSNIVTKIDQNAYILELGTSQLVNITTIGSTSTTGVYEITTQFPNYLETGDEVNVTDTNTSPVIDGTYYVIEATNVDSFLVSTGTLVSLGTANTGTIRSRLTIEQGKDVGIQVNYWSTVGNVSVTSGTANYKTGFFGFQRNTERWVYYNDATINNNIVTEGDYSDIQINKLYTNKISGFELEGALSGGSNIITGNNFDINGGSIDNTSIGGSVPSSGKFTSIENTTNATFNNVQMGSTLSYSFERYTLSTGSETHDPSVSTITSIFNVSGSNLITSGTMPTLGVSDGTYKVLVCSSMGSGCEHIIYFGQGNLVTPNPLNISSQPQQITFKRQSQSAQLVYDSQAGISGAWILLSSGGYVS